MNAHQDDPTVIKEKKKEDNIMFRDIYVGRQGASG